MVQNRGWQSDDGGHDSQIQWTDRNIGREGPVRGSKGGWHRYRRAPDASANGHQSLPRHNALHQEVNNPIKTGYKSDGLCDIRELGELFGDGGIAFDVEGRL